MKKNLVVGPDLENILKAAMYNAGRAKQQGKIPWLPKNVGEAFYSLNPSQYASIRQTVFELIRVSSFLEEYLVKTNKVEFSKEVLTVLVLLLKDLQYKIEFQSNEFSWPEVELGNIEDVSIETPQDNNKINKIVKPF